MIYFCCDIFCVWSPWSALCMLYAVCKAPDSKLTFALCVCVCVCVQNIDDSNVTYTWWCMN